MKSEGWDYVELVQARTMLFVGCSKCEDEFLLLTKIACVTFNTILVRGYGQIDMDLCGFITIVEI